MHHAHLQPPIFHTFFTFGHCSADELADAAVAYEPSPAGAGTLSAMMANGSISRIGNHTACGAVGSNFQVRLGDIKDDLDANHIQSMYCLFASTTQANFSSLCFKTSMALLLNASAFLLRLTFDPLLSQPARLHDFFAPDTPSPGGGAFFASTPTASASTAACASASLQLPSSASATPRASLAASPTPSSSRSPAAQQLVPAFRNLSRLQVPAVVAPAATKTTPTTQSSSSSSTKLTAPVSAPRAISASKCDRMRGVMVDWLIEVALEFRLSDDSLFLAVALLDRLFACMPTACEKRDAQLMAEVCLLIASKVPAA